ncbi:MAG: hypothetical protein HOA75_16590 [Deltaproteobacteria bacterium]|nr:hypothetical protein [Deltaproteobacteria bacterium]
MFKKLLLIGVAFLTTTTAISLAADSSKLRLLVPVQGTSTGNAITKNQTPAGTIEKITPSGYSVHYVASAGWGIGYTSHSYEQEEKQSGNTYMFDWDTTYLDLSYTFGSEITGQIFYGHQLNQSDIEYTFNGVQQTTAKKDSTSGSAIGINGGYDFGGFELLLGYRMESANFKQENNTTDYNLSRSLISAGVGFSF